METLVVTPRSAGRWALVGGDFGGAAAAVGSLGGGGNGQQSIIGGEGKRGPISPLAGGNHQRLRSRSGMAPCFQMPEQLAGRLDAATDANCGHYSEDQGLAHTLAIAGWGHVETKNLTSLHGKTPDDLNIGRSTRGPAKRAWHKDPRRNRDQGYFFRRHAPIGGKPCGGGNR